MRTSPFAWLDARLLFLTKSFACQLSKPDIRIFPTLEPLHVKKATTSKDGPFTQMEELVSLMDETSTSWGAVARSPDGRLFFMFGTVIPVIATEAHLAYAGARIHANNTAELSSIVEAAFLPWAQRPGCP